MPQGGRALAQFESLLGQAARAARGGSSEPSYGSGGSDTYTVGQNAAGFIYDVRADVFSGWAGQADERGSGAGEHGLIGVVSRRQAKRLQCWTAFIRIHPHLPKRRTGPRAGTRRRGRACICPGPNGSKSSAASGAPSTVRTHPADHRGSRVIAVQRDRLALNHPSVEGQAHRPIRCNELAQMRHAPP